MGAKDNDGKLVRIATQRPLKYNYYTKIELFKGTSDSAGYDIRCSKSYSIPSHSQTLVDIGIVIESPSHCFVQQQKRIGMVLKHNIHVKVGTIDANYRGEIKVLLSNKSFSPYHVKQQRQVAHLIIFHLPETSIGMVDKLSDTIRDKKRIRKYRN